MIGLRRDVLCVAAVKVLEVSGFMQDPTIVLHNATVGKAPPQNKWTHPHKMVLVVKPLSKL